MLKFHCDLYVRPGLNSTWATPREAGPNSDRILLGNAAASRAASVTCPPTKYGSDRVSRPWKLWVRVTTSKIPPPPRMEVLPSLNGSQAKPIRGAQFLCEGLV